jgi:hypothetical protein
MAEWFFSEKGINDKERDPGWDEYFSSNRSTVDSLVRESIHNSLDATALKCRHELLAGTQSVVRIFYSGEKAALPASDYAEYLDKAAPHYMAKECGIDPVEGDCPYFVIEDFNTDGLVGDILADNENEPYFKFLKCENKSTKNEPGSIGKWGIGKVAFPMASRIRTFFAYSIRSEEKYGPTRPGEVLAGECLLRYHTVHDRRYTPDGWWGCQSKGRNTPAKGSDPESATDIARFKKKFHVTRKEDEPGLSIVVPYVGVIDLAELQRSIVENFMVALVNGTLRVELRDGNGTEIIYDRGHATDILEFLEKLASAKDADDDSKRIAEMFKMVLEAETIPDSDIRTLACYDGQKPVWQDEQFSEEIVKLIQEDLAKTGEDVLGAPTVIKVPIRINKKHARETPEEYFKVVLRRCASPTLPVSPRFYRHGLFISHVGVHRVPGFTAVVLLDGPVADMMNEAEPPSHTQWFANTGTFSRTYNYPEDIIQYVKRAPRQIVKRVDAVQDKDDFETLKDFFSISRASRLGVSPGSDSEGQSGGDGKKRGGKGKVRRKKPRKPDPNRPRPEPPKPKPYILERYVDADTDAACFRVIADPVNFRAFMFTATLMRPGISGKSAFDKNDFSLQRGGTIKVYADGAEMRFPQPNVIEAKIDADRRDFIIEVKGFDRNFDLDIDDHYRDPSKWNLPEATNG